MFTTLTTLDLGTIIGYLLVTLLFGIWLRRRASQSLEHYYLGGRSLPWQLLGVSGMTNWFDLTGTMVIVSFLYMLGPRGLFIEFRGGAVLVLVFMMLWTGKWYRRSGCMTKAEWYEFRFRNSPGASALRAIYALFGIVFTLGMLAYVVRGSTLFLGYFFPGHGLAAAIVVIFISALYTMLAGYYGVVVNDLIQGTIIVIGCIIIAVIAYLRVADAATLATLAEQVTGNPEWMKSAPSLHATMPPGYEAYNALLLFTGFYFFRTLFDGAGAGDDPRYFGSRTENDAGRLSLLQMFAISFRWPMMMGFAVIGILLTAELVPNRARVADATAIIKAAHPETTQADWQELTNTIAGATGENSELARKLSASLGPRWREALPLVGWHGGVNPEIILPAVLQHSLPNGVRGFLMIAMLAALMSTLAGHVNGVGSALFVRDIYQKFLRPRASNRELIFTAYIATGTLIILGFVMGLAAKNINHLWGWIMMGFAAGAIAPQFLRLYWSRCTAIGCAAGIATGGTMAVLQRLLMPDLLEWQQFLLTCGSGFIAVVIGSLLTKPPPREDLQKFFHTTRPFGFWKPFRDAMPADQRAAMDRENLRGIFALPFALMMQITLFMLPMQFIIHAYTSFWITLPLFLVGAAGMWFFWGRYELFARSTKPVSS